jgi:signal transduction histidine kinase
MAAELNVENVNNQIVSMDVGLSSENASPEEAKLLMQAFEIFTNASNSLESAFSRLQAHVQRLTIELEAKNLQLERSLREKQEAQNYLRTILERLPCGVFAFDSSGNITLCNPVAAEVLSQCNSGAGRANEPFLNNDMRECLSASLHAEANAEIELRVNCDGRERILSTSGAHLTNEAGDEIGALHIIRDVTEVNALQEKNKRIERLSAMGEMAVELAHEIRNPLGSIELFASLLIKELSGDPKRWAENIRIGTRSLNTIVTNMLHFANPGQSDFFEVDVNAVIEETVKFTEPLMRQRHVRIETALNAEKPSISGDHELLKQMMLNLVFNAMKAMPSKGAITINTRNLERRGSAPALELQVSDTGIGIPTENLSRIFDPFFTTNKNGTGLGLSVVHQIVQRHSGKIWVSSEVNRGTTFTILFECEQEKD